MKKLFIAAMVMALVIAAGTAFSQNEQDEARLDDRTERDLEILSDRLVRMKSQMDKFVKDMSAAYQDKSGAIASSFGSDVRVDVVENEKDVVVTADLPGMDKDRIDVTLENSRYLKISGSRNIETSQTAPGVVKRERMEGRFDRMLELPAECKSEGITASYNNGVLQITIPKQEPKKVETVKVKVL